MSTNTPSPNHPPSRSETLAWTALVVVCAVLLVYRGYGPQFRTRPTLVSFGTLDVNTADRVELLQVPGVGPTMADAIVAHRTANGPFHKLDELDHVHGIGTKTLDKLRPYFSVSSPAIVRAQAEPTLERLERKSAPPTPTPSATSQKVQQGETVNVNTADLRELQRLPGIGPKFAERIIAERAKAKFTCVDDLKRVSGIGVKTVEKLRPFVVP
jgi:competence protein ComEA